LSHSYNGENLRNAFPWHFLDNGKYREASSKKKDSVMLRKRGDCINMRENPGEWDILQLLLFN
jgi:hypothetical protein